MIRDRILARHAVTRQGGNPTGRVEMRGAIDIANVEQARYREDLKFNLTDKQYESYNKETADFRKQYSNVMSTNQAALKQNKASLDKLNAYAASLEGKSADDVWEEASKGFTPVYVVNGNNKSEIVGTYAFPKDVVDKMASESFNQGKGSYGGWWEYKRDPSLDSKAGALYNQYKHGTLSDKQIVNAGLKPEAVRNLLAAHKETFGGPKKQQWEKVGDQWTGRPFGESSKPNAGDYILQKKLKELMYKSHNVPKAYYISDIPAGVSDRYGKELREGLTEGQEKVKSSFYNQISPQIAKYNADVKKELDVIGTKKQALQGYISTSEENIASAKNADKLRKQQIAAYKSQYDTSKAHRQALFV